MFSFKLHFLKITFSLYNYKMFIKIISKQNYIVRLKRFDFYFVIRDPPSKKKKESQKKKDSVLSC